MPSTMKPLSRSGSSGWASSISPAAAAAARRCRTARPSVASAKALKAPRDTFQRPQPGDVGDGDQQRRPPLGDAQVAHQAGLVLALGEMPIERLVEFGENGVRPPLDEPNQEIGLLEAALRKKGTVAEEGGKKPLPGRLVGERPHLGGKRRVGGFRRFAPVHQAEALRRVIGGCRQMVVSGGRR